MATCDMGSNEFGAHEKQAKPPSTCGRGRGLSRSTLAAGVMTPAVLLAFALGAGCRRCELVKGEVVGFGKRRRCGGRMCECRVEQVRRDMED
jgi:hypothetical protein